MNKFNSIFYEDKDSSVGIYPQKDGTFLALTFSGYKKFKTYEEAEKEILKRCYFGYYLKGRKDRRNYGRY